MNSKNGQDRQRRGYHHGNLRQALISTALALISSGGYLAGFVWPTIFERAIAHFGWQHTMMGFAVAQLVVIVPLAVIFLQPPPELPTA